MSFKKLILSRCNLIAELELALESCHMNPNVWICADIKGGIHTLHNPNDEFIKLINLGNCDIMHNGIFWDTDYVKAACKAVNKLKTTIGMKNKGYRLELSI